MPELKAWASSPWSETFPGDSLIVGDTVVDRSVYLCATASRASAPSPSADADGADAAVVASPADSAALAALEARLSALDEALRLEGLRVSAARARADKVAAAGGLSNRACPTGLPAPGLLLGGGPGEASLSAALVAQVLGCCDFRARAATRVASPAVQRLFRGPQEVVGQTWKGEGLPSLEVRPTGPAVAAAAAGGKPPTFLVPKSAVKVVSLAAGDEVFFRPSMMFKAFDQDQDWPRARVKEVRGDGVVVAETWSWRLANGKGAMVYAQWGDVRRAPGRTKYQMLPEQRVWRPLEVKEQATKLLTAAMEDERCQAAWSEHEAGEAAAAAAEAATAEAAVAAAVNGDCNDEAKASAVPASPTAAAAAAAVSPKKKAASAAKAAVKAAKPLANSAVLLLFPATAADATAVALVKRRLADVGGLRVVEEGRVSGETVAKERLVETHLLCAAAKRAESLKPYQLEASPAERKAFEEAFGVGWFDAMQAKALVNAAQAEAELASEAQPGDEVGGNGRLAALAAAGRRVVLGPDFTVHRIELPPAAVGAAVSTAGATAGVNGAAGANGAAGTNGTAGAAAGNAAGSRVRYVVNAGYGALRGPLVAAGSSVGVLVVEWDAAALPWAYFLRDIVGSAGGDGGDGTGGGSGVGSGGETLVRLLADHHGRSDAAGGTTDGLALATTALGVHASASPFAALVEKTGWLAACRREGAAVAVGEGRERKGGVLGHFSASGDAFGKALLGGSMSEATLRLWGEHDPSVTFGLERKAVSAWLHGLDSTACALKAKALAADPARKLDAAKAKYLEAVSFVEG